MCGGRKARARALRYQTQTNGCCNRSLLTGATPLLHHNRGQGVNNLVSAIAELSVKPQHIQPQQQPQYSNQVPAYPVDYKSSDVKDLPPPPSYEHVISANTTPEVLAREVTHSTYNDKSGHRAVRLPANFQTSNPQVSELIETLRAALAAVQAGSGRRMHVRRAIKALRNEIYEDEVARRTAMHGRLRCGEKCEIWREVKAIDFGY